jgi:hypothetical protein
MRSSGLPLHNKALRKACAEKIDPLCKVGCSGLSPLTSLIKRYFLRNNSACSRQTVPEPFSSSPQPPARLSYDKVAGSDLENGVVCGHFLFQSRPRFKLNQPLAASTRDEKMFCIRNSKDSHGRTLALCHMVHAEVCRFTNVSLT